MAYKSPSDEYSDYSIHTGEGGESPRKKSLRASRARRCLTMIGSNSPGPPGTQAMRNVVAKRALIERYVISEQQGAGRGKREKEKKLFFVYA